MNSNQSINQSIEKSTNHVHKPCPKVISSCCPFSGLPSSQKLRPNFAKAYFITRISKINLGNCMKIFLSNPMKNITWQVGISRPGQTRRHPAQRHWRLRRHHHRHHPGARSDRRVHGWSGTRGATGNGGAGRVAMRQTDHVAGRPQRGKAAGTELVQHRTERVDIRGDGEGHAEGGLGVVGGAVSAKGQLLLARRLQIMADFRSEVAEPVFGKPQQVIVSEISNANIGFCTAEKTCVIS